MLALLAPLFAITAFLYALVGFGGGSTYSALLVLAETDYRLLPTIALTCNIVVVIGGTLRFYQKQQISLRRVIPFILTSIPAALIGGRLPISETIFISLLAAALFLSGIRLLAFQPSAPSSNDLETSGPTFNQALGIGGAIGFISGLVGIGGGIFLAPILYLTRWGTAPQIAGACSLFILVNSVSGLIGQVSKLADLSLLEMALPYWPLIIAVFVGGQIGSRIASSKLEPDWMRWLTAILILFVSVRLIWRLLSPIFIGQ